VSSDGTYTRVGAELPRGVAAALAAAEIRPSKLGPARGARLTEAERELYFWILRQFASDGRPGKEEIRAAADRLGVDAEPALTTLAREDLLHRGPDGEITVALPLLRTADRAPRPLFQRSRGGRDVRDRRARGCADVRGADRDRLARPH
jgi:hypothetical protein